MDNFYNPTKIKSFTINHSIKILDPNKLQLSGLKRVFMKIMVNTLTINIAFAKIGSFFHLILVNFHLLNPPQQSAAVPSRHCQASAELSDANQP